MPAMCARSNSQHIFEGKNNVNTLSFLSNLLYSGLGNLASYLAAHVLLCLLPAFYIAGAMTALIPKETVTRFLGRNTPKLISYPAAAHCWLSVPVPLSLYLREYTKKVRALALRSPFSSSPPLPTSLH